MQSPDSHSSHSIFPQDVAKAQIVRSRKAELRRCNTDLRRGEERRPETAAEEIQRLRKELTASLAAQKGLEIILSGLKEEKKYIKEELARSSRALQDIKEHLSEVEAQNEMLLSKVNLCVSEHKEKSWLGREQGERSLHERNKALSEQLLRVLDGYRNMKRKIKDVKEEKTEMAKRVGEAEYRISQVLRHMGDLCRRKNGSLLSQESVLVEDISSIEEILGSLRSDIRSNDDKRDER